MATLHFNAFIFFRLRKALQVLGLLLAIAAVQDLRAAQGIASTGNWDKNTTWTYNGVQRSPSCGDTLIIPAGVTVTVRMQTDYMNCMQRFYIVVNGTLQFKNGYKMNLPCNSEVVLSAGGQLKKETPGGGVSTYLRICECVVWVADQGPIYGPQNLTCTALPVSLLTFTADQQEAGVLLQWATASEINNQYFTCERSTDGKNFIPVGNIDGAGNSTELREYTFIDKNPREGRAYYRLRQNDYDGSINYSETVAVIYKSKRNLKLIQSYLDENRQLNISLINNNEDIDIRLFEISGKEVYSGRMNAATGFSKVIVPVTQISRGSYVLTISNGEEKVCTTIFVGN
jgi:hypothetical protein